KRAYGGCAAAFCNYKRLLLNTGGAHNKYILVVKYFPEYRDILNFSYRKNAYAVVTENFGMFPDAKTVSVSFNNTDNGNSGFLFYYFYVFFKFFLVNNVSAHDLTF